MLNVVKTFKAVAILATFLGPLFFSLAAPAATQNYDKGIYITQNTLERTDYLDYLIKRSKETGINTFIVDLWKTRPIYENNIKLVKAAGIKYVARIVVFPGGGDTEKVDSLVYREKVNANIQQALAAGADVIQLDYIRYSEKRAASPQNAQNILAVIKWFRERIPANIPLQIDIFGITSYKPSDHIGQDVKLFAHTISAVNPMIYPSHFWPYQEHSKQPHKTIFESLNYLYAQFDNNPPFDVHPFIEAANFHYKNMTNAEVQQYILAQIRGVEDAGGTQGWYVWSAKNKYDNLFTVLANNHIRSNYEPKKAVALHHKEHTVEAGDNSKAAASSAAAAATPEPTAESNTNTTAAATPAADTPAVPTAPAATVTVDAPPTPSSAATDTQTPPVHVSP